MREGGGFRLLLVIGKMKLVISEQTWLVARGRYVTT